MTTDYAALAKNLETQQKSRQAVPAQPPPPAISTVFVTTDKCPTTSTAINDAGAKAMKLPLNEQAGTNCRCAAWKVEILRWLGEEVAEPLLDLERIALDIEAAESYAKRALVELREDDDGEDYTAEIMWLPLARAAN